MQLATDITANDALPARLPKGFELGGCVVDGWLRDGGMAAIYRARRAVDDRRVALKLQLPSTAGDPSICARFDREAEVMARANGSPHVAELYDSGVLDDGRRFFVLEWVEGENLEELLDFLRNQDQRMPLERACRIGRDIARGLAELHEHGVLHLDLKPSNVMVAQGDEIKLVDFGIAADLHEPEATGGSQPEAAVMGTSGYMCPEQVAGRPSNPSFDVYALGVLMFEVISGTSVPRDGWKPETLPRLEGLRRGVPAALAELVRACLDFNPEQRPASAEAVMQELVRIIRGLESDGGGSRASRVSSEEIPVRTGGTELVPQSSVSKVGAAAPTPARTGGTEVTLTHEEVLLQSGMAPPLSPEVVAAARRQGEQWEQARARRSRVWWATVLGAVGVLAAVGVWLGRAGDGSDTERAEGSAAVEQVSVTGAAERVVPEPMPAAGNVVAVPSGSAVEAAGRADPAAGVEDQAAADEAEAAAPVSPSPQPEPRGGGESSKRSGASRGDRPSAEECRAARADAVAAKEKSRDWRRVLKATSTKGCWTTPEQRLERKRLRVEAYAELDELEKCIEEGGKSKDTQIAARVKFCQKQLGG